MSNVQVVGRRNSLLYGNKRIFSLWLYDTSTVNRILTVMPAINATFLIAELKSERIVSDQLETKLNEQPYIVGYSCWAIKFYVVLLNVPVIAKWT